MVITGIRTGINKGVDESMIACCCGVQEQFFTFRDNFTTGKPDSTHGRIYWEYVWEKGGAKILLRCYNTAWISQLKEQQGTLFYPEKHLQVVPIITADYVVAVFHHPYNWLPATTYRQFRAHIEETSDLILTGHEHEPDHYQKYSFKGEVNEYLEGAVFQEHGRPDRSGFHVVYLDLVAQRQRTVSFWWQNGMFVPDVHEDTWLGYKRGSRSGKRDFDLNDEFARWLEEPGACYHHPAKTNLSLSDFFVFPNLKELQFRGRMNLSTVR